MSENLNEVTRTRIRDFCVELAAENALDPVTRDELCRQLGDKVAGYVTGEVRPTDEDALVLARAHFGDADRVARSLSAFSAEVERQVAERKRAVRRLAVALALFTFLAPSCMFLVSLTMEFRGTPRSLGGAVSQPIDPAALKFVFGVLVFLAAIETCVVLAIRVNLRKTWQRLTGAALILPSIAVSFGVLSGGLRGLLTTAPAGDLPLCLLFVSLSLAGFLDLMGHLWLIGLLLASPRFDPVPLADKAYRAAS